MVWSKSIQSRNRSGEQDKGELEELSNPFSRIPLEAQIGIVANIKAEVNRRQNGRLAYLTISGSDLYGFPSQDSDIDYRGCYVTGITNLLGIKRSPDVIEMKPDIVLFEMRKEIGLALSGNCNVLEHINAPTIYKTPESMELKRLINNAISKDGLYNSYKGMSMFNYKKFILQGKKSYKKYLYVFRGLMAGAYALETGRIQPNIVELNQYFKIKQVNTLIKHKIEKSETAEVEDLKDSGDLDLLINDMLLRLDRAYEGSKIPDKVDKEDEEILNEYLVKLRMEEVQ